MIEEAHVVKPHAGVVQVVGNGLGPHVLHTNAVEQGAARRIAQPDEEGVRAVADARHAEIGDHDAELCRVALADPILGRLVRGCVQNELVRVRAPVGRRLDDQTAQHARLHLGEQETSELPLAMDLGERGDLLGPTKPQDAAGEQVELDRETDSEPTQPYAR